MKNTNKRGLPLFQSPEETQKHIDEYVNASAKNAKVLSDMCDCMENFKEYTPEEWIEKNRHPKQILLLSADNDPIEVNGEDLIPHEINRNLIKNGIQLDKDPKLMINRIKYASANEETLSKMIGTKSVKPDFKDDWDFPPLPSLMQERTNQREYLEDTLQSMKNYLGITQEILSAPFNPKYISMSAAYRKYHNNRFRMLRLSLSRIYILMYKKFIAERKMIRRMKFRRFFVNIYKYIFRNDNNINQKTKRSKIWLT